MRLIILGLNGFVGCHLYRFLSKGKTELLGFNKDNLDFSRPDTFANYVPLHEDILIDCIAKIDGSEEEVNGVNLKGLTKFIEYLNTFNVTFKYVYFSTYATCLTQQVTSNSYVRSKFFAEEMIRKNVIDYKIIRLIFPFGKGENANRLISRILNKIQSREIISVDKFTLNLTPLNDLRENFSELINSPEKEINFSNGVEIFLPELIEFIYDQSGIEPKYSITDKEMKIVSPSTSALPVTKDAIYKEIMNMLHD